MKVLGKCPPEPEELERATERGFEYIELYLEKKHLEDIQETVKYCRNAEVEVESVHTPHVSLAESEYFVKADKLARELDAYLVFHTKYLHHVDIPELEELSIESDHGYENNPGNSIHHLENMILGRGHQLVLDTAHLYMATNDFQSELKQVLKECSSSIELIHVCDSTDLKDGLGFGEGDMDMGQTIHSIVESDFDGKVVLEVMPEYQEEALQKWNRFSS